jgi:segregation and condensation protein B
MASLAEKRIADDEEDPVHRSQAGLNHADPSRIDASCADPSRADSNRMDPNLAGSSLVHSNPEDPQARPEALRLLEALLFAASEPLDQAMLAKRMPDGVDIKVALAQLQADYASRGVNLVRVANKWTFRTAGDLSWLMTREITETRRLSRAAIEVLSIIAYHQPITRAEIEDIRGVITSKGTLDVLLETGWIKPRGRRKTPGRPLTFGTTDTFLSQFSLEALGDLPGLEELKGTGLLDSRLPTGFTVPTPSDDPALREDEEPLEAGDLELTLAPPVEPEGEGES